MADEPRSASRADSDPEFEALLEFLRDNRGFDFTGYKRASLQRRIGRRMQQVGCDTWTDYIDHLQFHAEEFTELFNTILINVTGFFRDADAWAHLRADILPGVVEGKRPSQTVRVWSAGTASGEEAYSAAMLLAEELGPQEFRDRVKVYATDVDEEALAQARQGVYGERQVAAVPEDLRQKYFEQANGSYTFRKDLRRCIIFGRNDLVQDAPISRVDLLVCRNTLMYFDAETQDRVLRRFHFALAERGVLFLGKAETLLSQSRLFRPVDLRRRFFHRMPGSDAVPRPAALRLADGTYSQGGASLLHQAFDASPDAMVVVGGDGTLRYFNQRARELFSLGSADLGRPFRELDASLRPVDLRPLLDRVTREAVPVTVEDVDWQRAGEATSHVNVVLRPLAGDDTTQGTAVFFVDVSTAHRLQQDLHYVNRQLETSYEELQSTVEELETTNEELQSTVEELETTNEELQSTNEELETTNEELQSTNDELQSANDELNERSAEVAASNAFMDTVLRSLDAAVVVVDLTLRVSSWSERAEGLWGLRGDEVTGRRLDGLDIGLPLDVLVPRVRQVLAGGGVQQCDVEAVNRRGRTVWLHVRCNPLTERDGTMSGAILFMEERPGQS